MAEFRILLAIDADGSAPKAVAHVAKLAAASLVCDVTLFHVPKTPASLSKYGASRDRCEDEALEDLLSDEGKEQLARIHREANDALFDPAEKVLLDGGSGVTVRRLLGLDFHSDIASAIVDQARKGDYDAVVLSRRRQSTLADLALGSVSSKVVHATHGTSVWLVEP